MKKIIHWIPAALWLAVIFTASSVRVDFRGDNINLISRVLLAAKEFLMRQGSGLCIFAAGNLDRIYHAFEYFIFTLFVYYGMKMTRGALKRRENFLLTGIAVMLTGIADELHQIFIPTRYCSLFDLLADAAGMALMTGVIILTDLTARRQNAV